MSITFLTVDMRNFRVEGGGQSIMAFYIHFSNCFEFDNFKMEILGFIHNDYCAKCGGESENFF